MTYRDSITATLDAHDAEDADTRASLAAAQTTVAEQADQITALQAQITAGPVGAGIIRSMPTEVIEQGDKSIGTWSGPVVSLKEPLADVILRGFIARSRDAGYLVENVIVEPLPEQIATLKAGRWLHAATGSYANQGVMRYSTLRGSAPSRYTNGISGRNMHYEAVDVHHVTDGVTPIGSASSADVNMLLDRVRVHDHLFALDPGHAATPTKAADGTIIVGPYAGKPWNHCDCVQVERDDLTGLVAQDCDFDARWAVDALSLLPLPNARKELSCLMLNGGRRLKFIRCRFNGGEQAINNNDPAVTGEITDCVFGPDIMHDAKGPLAMVLRAPGLVESGNTWADGTPITARR